MQLETNEKKIKRQKENNSRAPNEWFYHRLILFGLEKCFTCRQETGIVVKNDFFSRRQKKWKTIGTVTCIIIGKAPFNRGVRHTMAQ